MLAPGAFFECSRCLRDMDMPWGWILEYLLDVKKLPVSFLKDFIAYVPQIEQPQCSRLLQKVALRYEDEATANCKLDIVDVCFMRFLKKEQGVSDLRRIHSLKESFENDLTLRVEAETVLLNLRRSSKEGSTDWAAFEDAVDGVFDEDRSEGRALERRKELTAVLPTDRDKRGQKESNDIFAAHSGRLQDQTNGEVEEHLCEQLLGKYPPQELFRDLTHFVGDKRKFFTIKFLDQLAIDVENGVYSFSPGSDSPETQTPLELQTDFCDDWQVQDNSHLATALPGSTRGPSQNDKPIATVKDGDSDPGNSISGAKVSEAKNVQEEMSFGMAEVDEVAYGLANEIHELQTDLVMITEDVRNTASIPFSTPDLSVQLVSCPAPRSSENPVSMQQKSVAMRTASTAEVGLEIDKPADELENRASVDNDPMESLGKCTERQTLPQHAFASVAGTSLMSPEKVTKRLAVEIVEQDTVVAKKRKCDDAVETSEEQLNHNPARGQNIDLGFRPVVQTTFPEGPSNDTLSSENINNAVAGVSKSSKYDLSAAVAGNRALKPKCHFCGNSGGCQALCHRCSVSIHEDCLSELFRSRQKVQSCWHCFACADALAQEGLKVAKEALRKAEEEALKSQESLATFSSAKRERSLVHPKRQNDTVEFNKGTPCRNEKSIPSVYAVEGSTEGFRSGPGLENRNTLSKGGTITARMVSSPKPTVQNVTERDTNKHICQTSQEIIMQPTSQATVLSGGLHAARGKPVPDPVLLREGIGGQDSISVPSLPVSQSLAPEDKHPLGASVKQQSGGPRDSTNEVLTPLIPDANDNDTLSGRHDVHTKDLWAICIATNESGGSRPDVGNSGSLSEPLVNSRILEGEEGDGHDGDLEEVCEASLGAAERTNTAEEAVGKISETKSEALNVGVKSRLRRRISETKSEALNVGGKSRPRRQISETNPEALNDGVKSRLRRQAYRGRKEIPGIRRRHLPWTESEEDALKEGVSMFSNGGAWGFQWKRILDFGVSKFHESRTAVDLKDKWRNMLSRESALSSRSS